MDTPPADRHIELPQGTNTLVGNMRLVTISALMTIFGVGAEIGIVGVLAVVLSNASTPGRWLIGVLLGFVAVFALWYSKTAIESARQSAARVIPQQLRRDLVHALVPARSPARRAGQPGRGAARRASASRRTSGFLQNANRTWVRPASASS